MDAAEALAAVPTHGATARWMHVGRSTDSDAAVAARAALSAATGSLEPRLLLVFAAASYELGRWGASA